MIYDYSLFLSHHIAKASQILIWLLLAHIWLTRKGWK